MTLEKGKKTWRLRGRGQGGRREGGKEVEGREEVFYYLYTVTNSARSREQKDFLLR